MQPAGPLSPDQAQAVADAFLKTLTGGRFTDSITLVDPESGRELNVRHATPSARRRIEFYRLEAKRPKTKAEKVILERVKSARIDVDPSLDIERQIEVRGMDLVREAMIAGDLSPDDIANGKSDPQYVEESTRITLEQFRACVSHAGLSADDVLHLQDVDWLMDQNLNDVTLFVRSFRSLVDGERIPGRIHTPMAGIPRGT